jgi:hypothetical protein
LTSKPGDGQVGDGQVGDGQVGDGQVGDGQVGQNPDSLDSRAQEDWASFTASAATEVSAYSLKESTRFWAPFLTFCC